MTSRLDRLFVLLESGAGTATRRAAARQLGEVQKAHPEELHRLLGRLMKHLRSPAWETRIAAAQAVGAILANVPEWQPPDYAIKTEEDQDVDEVETLRCETFNIERILHDGAHLMGSEGHEYDMEEETLSAIDQKDRIAKQRQQLNAKLGLDVAYNLGMDISSIYSNEDLYPIKAPTQSSASSKIPVTELIPSKPLSSREINLAKRKARLAFSKQKSRDCSEDGSSAPPTPPAEPDRKRLKLEQADEFIAENEAAVPDCTGVWGESARWPLERWSAALRAQMFSAAWEARHGAASALRELLAARVSATAGVRAAMTPKQMEDAHQVWLEDMALRLLCVLALDRFGDFVSDQVVAPVRETCAQTLGVALSKMRLERVRLVAAQLAALAQQPQWEARHGALLAFKYLLAASPGTGRSCGAVEQLVRGLDDSAEDVSAAAAGALAARAADAAPCAARLAARLWALLRDQDELAAPATAYLALLAALCATPAPRQTPVDLEDVLPRLWPYMDHTSSSVRKATLETLRMLTRPLQSSEPKNGTTNGDVAYPNGSKSDEQYLMWTPQLLQEAMRYVYQRILFEHVHEIQEIAVQVWHNFLQHASLSAVLVAACPMLATWLCLAMQPARLAVDAALLLQPPSKERKARTSLSGPEVVPAELRPVQKWFVGGSESQPCELRDRNVTRARCLAADLLGYLSCYLVRPAPGIEYKPEDESPINCYVKVMLVYVRSASALQRLVGALVLAAWARHSQILHAQINETNGKSDGDLSNLAPSQLITSLHTALTQALYYDEVALSCNRILQEARDLHAMMKHYQLAVDGEEFNNILRLEQVLHLTQMSQPLIAAMKNKRAAVGLEDRRKNLQSNVTQCSIDQNSLNVSVQAALASACANLNALPEKLNPVIRPLMESIKKEPSEELQQASAETLAALLRRLSDRDPCPNPKVLANLKTFLRCDPELTPRVSVECPAEGGESGSDSGPDSRSDAPVPRNSYASQPPLDKYSGILTLREQHRRAESAAPRRGRPPTVNSHAQSPAAHAQAQALLDAQEDEARKTLRIQRRGATLALTSLTEHFGDELPDKLPKLWEFISEPLLKTFTDDELVSMSEEEAEELISRLQVVEVVCAKVSRGAWALVSGSGALACCAAARSPYTALRHMAARALAALADRDSAVVVHAIVNQLVPALSDVRSDHARCGAAEALARTVDRLQLRAVPYAVLLVVPLLGRMSDHCGAVRTMATRCFASLIQLMPLDGAVPEPAGLSPEMRARRLSDRRFLEKLFNPKSIEDYKIPVPIATELRSYQQAGVNWLRFLNEYALHGVLCDDMGLGKTLQSIVVVASSHWERARDRAPALPSLVVCPPTLTGHWVFEVNKFIPNKFLKPLQYVGPPAERERLRSLVKRHNLIVASYDIVRKDIEFFSSVRWNYCVLDEGHVIKNGKTKAFKAIKQLIANHRLILSGTPIQNDVLELWSLFDFLMPGLLGTERQFTARYSRPILAARDPRATPHQLQAGALACEALHRQVLPFLLRRVKEDVLKELPPKITQDYYCELSPLQRLLYEHFSKDHMPKEITSHTHVFQALHYLQNVCNHPKLVLTPEHPEAARVAHMLAAQGSSLDDIQHSAKLLALKQLLVDCGIGCVGGGEAGAVGAAGARRALVFCQLQRTLDIVERDLLRRHLPRVHYLRLDGSLPPPRRHRLVQRFNADVSIDLLLLTTKVGGLGLNLTGADTVIFVEHDWNPMKDLQAMDRAHRIGQKKVVNVYRLITRDTLEEKIMGLQKFKLMTANTVISSENAAMETMGTDQLLELFPGASPIAPVPTCEMEQYGDEYDMDAYVRRLTAADSTDRADDAHHTDSVDYCAIASHYSNVAPTGSADHTDVGSRANVYVQQLAAADGTDHADYIHHIDTVSRVELVDRAVPLNNYYSRNITVAADNTSTPNGDCAFDLTAVANCAATSKRNECNVTAKRTVAANRSGIANYASGSPSTDDDATSDEIDISSNDIAI